MDASRLNFLLNRYLDQALTPAEKSELEQMLLASAEARAEFWEQARFHALLRRHGEEQQGRHLVFGGQVVAFGVEPQKLIRLPWVWATALAACLALALFVWLPGRNVDDEMFASEAVTIGVATLTRMVDASWDTAEEDAPQPGELLAPGWLHLREGLVQIDFFNGAHVIIEGPAEFEIISAGEMLLKTGRLTGNCPPQARTFKVRSPQMDVVDLGTSFGFNVQTNGSAEVHVFDGKVEVSRPGTAKPQRELVQGEALRASASGNLETAIADRERFPSRVDLEERARRLAMRRLNAWRERVTAPPADPSLKIHFAFESAEDNPVVLVNHGQTGGNGTVVGADWTTGRWPGKPALEFKRVSDRVRLQLTGEMASMTIITWVRIDALSNPRHALLLPDRPGPGTPFWNITRAGELLFGVRDQGRMNRYKSPRVITPERQGRWLQLAVVYDPATASVMQFVNGRPVSRHTLKEPTGLKLGAAEIGNWGRPHKSGPQPVINFIGRMDEFLLFDRALTPKEIRASYTAGQPAT
ncbi:MAG TPA: hypothetical protein DCY13_00045 [Verrucomicrobiales bacterium]|nr:hypothetical protein [Verrucomicrobiales bacterium]